MARIRTIKPEFVESESVGKLSRDARLLFVLLWTFVDDEGRARASSRLLASRLYPYDEDAANEIDYWLDELEQGGHIRRYEIDGDQYLDIPKWLKHQKIDHPTKSRLPEFREGSRKLASADETIAPHTLDLGPVPRTSTEEGERSVALATPPPTNEAVDIFNAMAAEHDWPKVQVLNAARKSALVQCLKAIGGLDGWQTLLAKVVASDFLMGRTKRSDEHAGWRFDFDFVVKPKRYIKLMEGGYDNPRNSPVQGKSGLSAALAGLAD